MNTRARVEQCEKEIAVLKMKLKKLKEAEALKVGDKYRNKWMGDVQMLIEVDGERYMVTIENKSKFKYLKLGHVEPLKWFLRGDGTLSSDWEKV